MDTHCLTTTNQFFSATQDEKLNNKMRIVKRRPKNTKGKKADASSSKGPSASAERISNNKKKNKKVSKPTDDKDKEDEEVEKESPEPQSKAQDVPKGRKKGRRKKQEEPEESSEESSEEEEEDEASSSSDEDDDDESEDSSGDSDDDDDDDEDSDDDDSDDDEEEEDGNDKKVKGGPLFSDENAKWLKPKKSKLMDSDDDSDDDDDNMDDDDELLEVEKQSRLVDAEMEAEKKDAEEELRRTIAEETEVFHLPTAEELASEEDRVMAPSDLRNRIESILQVLADFKTRREPGRARSDYVDQLVRDMAELFGYLPELVEYFVSMLGPTEALEFLRYSDRPRPLVIRTNTLKVRRKDLAASLMKRGVQLDPLAPWSKVGIKIVESSVPIGATPEYLSGQYMLQSAASMCPVLALAPQPHEKILDVSAAPGGKTSYMAQLMRNTGVLLANDLRPDRQKATVANLHRLGVQNTVTCRHDGRQLGHKFPNTYDRILLDAPCSGLGVISRDPSVKVQRTMADVHKCAHLQKELLLSAIDALKPKKGGGGGVLVYSTCSVSVAENEQVIQYALSKRNVRVVDTGLTFGKPGFTRYQQKRFHPSLSLTRRFYPHVHNMDGFFVCKLLKLDDNGKPTKTNKEEKEEEQEEEAEKQEEEQGQEQSAGEDATEKKKTKKKKHNLSSKSKRKGDNDKADRAPRKKPKSDQLSIPPKAQTKKKKTRMNAKMTKPRRRKPPPSSDNVAV